MRYLDTGGGDEAQGLGRWLTENLTIDIQGFRCQSGYYGYRALYLFEDILRELSVTGRDVHLVIGSNHACLSQSHLEWTLEIIGGGANTSLTVVAYSNAEFHPKTIHITRADGSEVAVVGSANLTENGLGLNVEAAVSIDTDNGDDTDIPQQIAGAIDRWRDVDTDGVFHIEEPDDILLLKEARVIDEPQQPQATSGGAGQGSGDDEYDADTSGIHPGVRQRIWRPARQAQPPAPQLTAVTPLLGAGRGMAIVAPLPPLRWCKVLSSSDAQWVNEGTSPTGKLRLAQARHPIDHRRFFRYQLFGQLHWASEMRTFRGHTNEFEVASVSFEVTIRGVRIGRRTLTVDHAWHREADQNNVPTVLAWGTEINALLAAQSHTGNWVLIERDSTGAYSLTIQAARPAWAP